MDRIAIDRIAELALLELKAAPKDAGEAFQALMAKFIKSYDVREFKGSASTALALLVTCNRLGKALYQSGPATTPEVVAKAMSQIYAEHAGITNLEKLKKLSERAGTDYLACLAMSTTLFIGIEASLIQTMESADETKTQVVYRVVAALTAAMAQIKSAQSEERHTNN